MTCLSGSWLGMLLLALVEDGDAQAPEDPGPGPLVARSVVVGETADLVVSHVLVYSGDREHGGSRSL